MRSFASKTFDALGATADEVYEELEHQLADLLPASPVPPDSCNPIKMNY